MFEVYSVSKGKSGEQASAFCVITNSLSQTDVEKLSLPGSLRFRNRGEKFRVPKSAFVPFVEDIMELVIKVFSTMDKNNEMLQVPYAVLNEQFF